MKSLTVLLRSHFIDLKRLLPEVKGFDRDLITAEARLEDEGIGFLSVALPSLGKAFDKGLSDGRFACPPGFARRESIPLFLGGMICNVFDAKTGLLLDKPSIECIRCIRETLYLFKKFTVAPSREKYLTLKAKREFVETDKSIFGVAEFRLDQLSKIGRLLVPMVDNYMELNCRHGPGAVAEGYRANQKWSALTSHLLDFDEKLNEAGYDAVSSLHVEDLSLTSSANFPLSSCARLVSVPKTATALRTITVEPLLNQFVQQGFNDLLRNAIKRCKVLKHCLSLDDQTKNQDLALIGSKTGDWCTVDLSSASDLLSLEVVKAVFRYHPRFLDGILRCRTSLVETPFGVINMKKYAGMGNATTFPVQSVAFAVIAMASILGGKEPTYRRLQAYAKCIRIYGDDIIIRSAFYPGLAEWITSCGLKINHTKTHSNGYFRESCGVDAYAGVNVTPVYLHSDPDLAQTEPSAFASLVSTANQLWLDCRYALADAIVANCGKLPLVRRDSSGIGLHTRQDLRTISRWNRLLQRFEFKASRLKPKRVRDELDGMGALMKFFHRGMHGYFPSMGGNLQFSDDDLQHRSSSVRRFNVKRATGWMPS